MSQLPPDLPLLEKDLEKNPLAQFRKWHEEAIRAGIPFHEAMVLATSGPGGRPSARVMLLKGTDDAGFVFFTNYESRKGKELAGNPHASLVFFWQSLQRQVRAEGSIEKVTDAESDAYFRTRPRGSQAGAWVSQQSSPIAGRQEMDSLFDAVMKKYEGKEIPRPPHWGGFRLVPSSVEFWQGRNNRLHDRLVYRSVENGWVTGRLAP